MIHLHNHSYYSLLDGHSTIKGIVTKAKQLGMPAVALTDHGNMYGALEFYKECEKQEIKPIIGCEVYVTPGSIDERTPRSGKPNDKIHHHLILIAKNETGFKNLQKIVSIGYTDGFYFDPRVDKDILRKYSEGLICTSACVGGVLPQTLLKDSQTTYNGPIDLDVVASNYEDAKAVALEYQEIFGKENYFIEIQNHGIEVEEVTLPYLAQIADEIGATLIATNDAHYLDKEDFEAYKTLLKVNTGSTADDDLSVGIQENELYFKTEEEMKQVIPEEYHHAIHNTHLVADMVDLKIKHGSEKEVKLPYFQVPVAFTDKLKEALGEKYEQLTTDQLHLLYMKSLLNKGLKERYKGKHTKVHEERIDYELSVISRMGFVDYFLIVADFVNHAKESGMNIGPGRGSGAGSLVAYLLKITEIDPIKYNLIFERFLNPERVSYPDFDIDFPDDRRGEAIDYVRSKYGDDHVAMIVTFGKMQAKAAIRDIGRVFDIPVPLRDKASKLIPTGSTITEALEDSRDFQEIYNESPENKRWIDMAIKLEGYPRNVSTHASGVIIADKPVTEYAPLTMPAKKKDDKQEPMIQYDKDHAESIGLLKFDFLGLATQSIITNATEMIKEKAKEYKEEYATTNDETRKKELEELLKLYREDFLMSEVSLEDEKVFELMSSGKTNGVFQLESEGMQEVATQLKPQSIEDVTALISLYRPGPMENIPEFIFNKENPDEIEKITEELSEIVKPTYGIFVYQEQIMQTFSQLAGYSYGRADIVRRTMTSKDLKQMEIERDSFVFGRDLKLGKFILTEKGLVKTVYSKSEEADFIPTYTEVSGKLTNTNMGTIALTVDGQTVDVKEYINQDRKVLDNVRRYGEDGTPNDKYEVLIPGATRFNALSQEDSLKHWEERISGDYRLRIIKKGKHTVNESNIFLELSADGKVTTLDADIKGVEQVDELIKKLLNSDSSQVEFEFSKVKVSKVVAQKLMYHMEKFVEYAFNKSHAVAYSYIAYYTAYLKTHFPMEFFVSLLNSSIGAPDKLKKYMRSAETDAGFTIAAPSINRSGVKFSPSGNEILFGLSAVKNVGEAVTLEFIKERELNGEFKSFYDFVDRMKKAGFTPRRDQLSSLIKAGAFDEFGNTRNALLKTHEQVLDAVKKDKASANQVSLFDYLPAFDQKQFGTIQIPDLPEMAESELLKNEMEVMGLYVSSHPLKQYRAANKILQLPTLEDITDSIKNEEDVFESETYVSFPVVIVEAKKRLTRTNKEMLTITVQDEVAQASGVMFEPNPKYNKDALSINQNLELLQPGTVLVANGKLQIRDDDSVNFLFTGFYEIPSDKEIKTMMDEKGKREAVAHVLNLLPKKIVNTAKAIAKKRKQVAVKPAVQKAVEFEPNITTSRTIKPGAYLSVDKLEDLREIMEITKEAPGVNTVYVLIRDREQVVRLPENSINFDNLDVLEKLHNASKGKGLTLVKKATV